MSRHYGFTSYWIILVCALQLLVSGAAWAQAPLSPEQRATALRRALETIEAAKRPTAAQYQRLFDLFPQRFADLREWFAEDRYNEAIAQILAEDRPEWDYGRDYRRRMCEAYELLDHKMYMRKLLRMGIEANNWGGPDNDEESMHLPGDFYKRLVFGEECRQLTQESLDARSRVIFEVTDEYSERQVESIYNSLAWDGMDRYAIEWFLDGLCTHSEQRCALSRTLRNKYVKLPNTDRHTH
jgi:hypothetical protein